MKFPGPLVEAKFLRREKRFFAYCEASDGAELVAHCPNPGSMKGNREPGSRMWLLDFGSSHPGRKLRYKWVYVESQGVRVCVDTSVANSVVEEALREGRVSEVSDWREVKPEATAGESRFDFLLSGPGLPDCFLEVKSVSMGEGRQGAFPDSVTERGQKHLRHLMDLRRTGKRAILFFLLMREGGKEVRPAGEIDPEYERLLREAVETGVEVLVYGTRFDAQGISLGEKGTLVL